jgi:voltage-gated sodium channel
MRPLLSMTALIALLLFLYGMVGTYLFSSELPAAWGSIGASVMSLIILLTLENFPIYLEDAMAVNALAIPFLLSYVFIIVFTVLNLLIGIVLNAMDEAREEAKQADQTPEGMKLIAQNVDQIAEDGVVTPEEIKALKLEISRLRSLLKEEK